MSANKTLRSKLEDFFNPGPSSNSKSSAKGLSRDIEDPVDIYNHTNQFFKSTETDQYADNVEIGERKIKGDIDLDDLIYGGKKISRKDLEG